MKVLRSRIIGSGSYLPQARVRNADFLGSQFYTADGVVNSKPTESIIKKLGEISGIEERRYATDGMATSDLAVRAAKDAILRSGIDAETLDYIIVAHNFGNVSCQTHQTDLLPNMAARVKQKLGITNSECVAYDILFGCPSWVQALIQADYYLRSGDARRALVIGADVLSAVLDPHDVDSMLFADGAGAVIVEAEYTDEKVGILAHKTVTDAVDKAHYLTMGESRNPEKGAQTFVKMHGPSIFKYGLEAVPTAIKQCLDKAGLGIGDVNKFFMHQANERMIRGMLQKLADLYQVDTLPDSLVPYTVQFLGNSSAATIPTLFDLVLQGEIEGHEFKKGDICVFASVGAGMHANCILYRH
jgi:3-oxoacyl-[acyl-carrier-protein] synthase-3